jgi:hypothetical protein
MSHQHSKLAPLKKVIAFINAVCLSLGSAFWLPETSSAETGRNLSQPQMRELAKSLIENVRTRNQVLSALEKAGASLESIDAIGDDLEKRLPETLDLPKVTLVKDEVLVDGKKSGLKIVSYAPLKIKLNGKMWSPKSHATTDQNYFSLVQFLEPKQAAGAIKRGSAIFTLLLPQAHAFFGGYGQGALSGALIGALGGTFMTMAMGASPLSTMYGMMIGAGVGSIIGGSIGAERSRERRIRELEERRLRRERRYESSY